MPRYLVERTYSEGFNLPGPDDDDQAWLNFAENNARSGVTWLHSYVTPAGKKSVCIYDAPDPESLRRAANRNELPIDRITEVRILKPYSYTAPDGDFTGRPAPGLESGRGREKMTSEEGSK